MLSDPPPPTTGKFAGRSRSDLKNFLILLGFLDLENFQLVGPPLDLEKIFGLEGPPLVSDLENFGS